MSNRETALRKIAEASSAIHAANAAIITGWPDIPTQPPNPDPPDPPPQDGVVRLSIPGLVHRATEDNPRRVIPIDAPQGAVYRSLELRFRYVHRWNGQQPDGIHGIAYLHRQRWNPDGVIANLIARGKGRNVVRLAENLAGQGWMSSESRGELVSGGHYDVRIAMLGDYVGWALSANGAGHEWKAGEIRVPTDGRILQLWLGGTYELHPDAQDVPSPGAEWHDLELVLAP